MTEATDPVDAAFAAVPRAGFLPETRRGEAAADRPLPIGRRQTCSQPSTVRAMLMLLDVRAGQRVLDVGAGSGWTTALLAQLVGPDGEVLGVELEPALAARGAAALARCRTPWARLEPAEAGRLGAPDRGPWDRVLVSAAARELPSALLEQLAPGGRMVLPVGATMTSVERDPDGTVRTCGHGSYSFVPLR